MASKVKKISSGTFKILSYLECSWENPWVFREHAPLAPHFFRLWMDKHMKYTLNPERDVDGRTNKLNPEGGMPEQTH